MSRRRPARRPARLLTAALLLASLGGCTDADDAPAASAAPADLPQTPAELAELLVTAVPSGLARVPDDDLDPPAGAKTLEDVASYAPDPARESEVLQEYGYLRGWERFWGADGPQTTVFVDQFATPEGAAAYAEDLARNDADFYGGPLAENAPEVPEACLLLTVGSAAAQDAGLAGPAAFAWCPHGVFSVGVGAVAATPEAAQTELSAVLPEQLALLPE